MMSSFRMCKTVQTQMQSMKIWYISMFVYHQWTWLGHGWEPTCYLVGDAFFTYAGHLKAAFKIQNVIQVIIGTIQAIYLDRK